VADHENAPLIEVVFEMRWGKAARLKQGESEVVGLQFPNQEQNFFPGLFRSEIDKKGYSCVEEANPAIQMMPHVVKHRFRKSPNQWPCYQIGLGVFTANQVNEGYTWESYVETVNEGLKVIDTSHPDSLKGLSPLGIELKYQDGFVFEASETPVSFLVKKMNIGFSLNEQFLLNPSLEDKIHGNSISFQMNSKKPEGVLIIQLLEGTISGKPGFIMDTTLRSADKNCPKFTLDSINKWLIDAHDIHKHAFKTLISPTLAATFK